MAKLLCISISRYIFASCWTVGDAAKKFTVQELTVWQHEPNIRAPNSALAVYKTTDSAQSIINASPLCFESGKVESSSPASQVTPSRTPPAEQEEGSGPAVQDKSDYAQEEFNEFNAARQRPNEVPGDKAFFTGLSGTARWGQMRSSPKTDQTARSPPPSKVPKPFTPTPTALKASCGALPSSLSRAPSTCSTSSYPPQEIHLTIERSVLDHHAYIQRQHYYGGFKLDLSGMMGEDLEGRVPVAGMADCQLGKPEVPLRVRLKRRHEDGNRPWTSLGSLWREGERARKREQGEKVGVDDQEIMKWLLSRDHAKHGHRRTLSYAK